MTNEQIKQNAEEYILKEYPKVPALTKCAIAGIFIAGAHSRDEEIESIYNNFKEEFNVLEKQLNQLRNPWRDASKELPPRDKRFDNHDTLKGCSKYVLTMSQDGDIVVARYNTIKKIWCNFKTYVTKPEIWMPIPKTQKGGMSDEK